MNILEKALDLIKIIIEKYLITGSIAIVISILLYATTRDAILPLIKLSEKMYGVLLFFASFILVLLIKHLLSKTIQYIQKRKIIKTRNEKIKEELLNIVDSMDPESRTMLDYLLEHNNNQVIIPSSMEIPYSIQPYCAKNDFQVNDEIYPFNPMNMVQENWALNPGIHATKVKLENDFYQRLKWLKEYNGAISNFD
ncbi:hypothetical protein IJI28_02895 [Candidatus Saccharibacteria bacterium]|nr:hypothetical protein [Candidatus Saccharibacteria bacterium]